MVRVNRSALSGLAFEGIRLTQENFEAGKDEGETVGQGEVAEVAVAEVGETSELTSYDVVRLGRSMDSTGNSPKGKIYGNLNASDGSDVAPGTEVRFVVRPKNGNRRVPLTEWFGAEELDIDRPDHRIPIPPVSHNGRPAFAKDGRIIAIEARNPTSDFEISLSESQLRVPASGGY